MKALSCDHAQFVWLPVNDPPDCYEPWMSVVALDFTGRPFFDARWLGDFGEEDIASLLAGGVPSFVGDPFGAGEAVFVPAEFLQGYFYDTPLQVEAFRVLERRARAVAAASASRN